MPYKDDFIRTIISFISGLTGDDFQSHCSTLLTFYYKSQGLKFEKVGAARGDFKNDGWVESKSIYYQMYSPEQFPESFINSLYSKFVEDFLGLCKHVYEDGKWSGKISKYFFLVNTRDRDIPHDESRVVSNTRAEMELKYSVQFDEVSICNRDYLIDLLNELDETQLESLTTILGLTGSFDVIGKTPKDYAFFINALASAIVERNFISGDSIDYDKIPDQDKIRINDLELYEDRIIKICAHLNTVEEAVEQYAQNESNNKKLDSIIKLYVDTYLELKNEYRGTQLYDKIIDTICSYLSNEIFRTSVEVFMVYIFDKCDIFERVDNAVAE